MDDGNKTISKARASVAIKMQMANGVIKDKDFLELFQALSKSSPSHNIEKTLNGFSFSFEINKKSVYILEKAILSGRDSFPFSIKTSKIESGKSDKFIFKVSTNEDFISNYLKSRLSISALDFDKFAPYITMKSVCECISGLNVYDFSPKDRSQVNMRPAIDKQKTTIREAAQILKDVVSPNNIHITNLIRETLSDVDADKICKPKSKPIIQNPKTSFIRSMFRK